MVNNFHLRVVGMALLQQAILAYFATMYEFREDVISGTIKTPVPEVVDRLIWPYRTFWEVPWL